MVAALHTNTTHHTQGWPSEPLANGDVAQDGTIGHGVNPLVWGYPVGTAPSGKGTSAAASSLTPQPSAPPLALLPNHGQDDASQQHYAQNDSFARDTFAADSSPRTQPSAPSFDFLPNVGQAATPPQPLGRKPAYLSDFIKLAERAEEDHRRIALPSRWLNSTTVTAAGAALTTLTLAAAVTCGVVVGLTCGLAVGGGCLALLALTALVGHSLRRQQLLRIQDSVTCQNWYSALQQIVSEFEGLPTRGDSLGSGHAQVRARIDADLLRLPQLAPSTASDVKHAAKWVGAVVAALAVGAAIFALVAASQSNDDSGGGDSSGGDYYNSPGSSFGGGNTYYSSPMPSFFILNASSDCHSHRCERSEMAAFASAAAAPAPELMHFPSLIKMAFEWEDGQPIPGHGALDL